MPQAIHISPIDNVVVALHPIAKGTLVEVDGLSVTALEDIPQGHKMAVKPIKNGENVIKYGFPIGHATADAAPGSWMHTHNVHTNLSGEVEYSYNPAPDLAPLPKVEPETFMGFRRKDGRAAIRNEIWIIPTVGCVNDIAKKIVADNQDLVTGSIEGLYTFTHPFGCSQTGHDHAQTRKLLAALVRHPNAAAVLVLVAALYAGVAVMNHFAGTSVSATGIITGAFAVMGAFVFNSVLVPLQNGFAMFANFVGNVFTNPVAAVKVLFYDMAITVLQYMQNIASAVEGLINMIPGVTVDLTSGLGGWITDLAKKRSDEIQNSGYTEYVKPWENMDLGSAYTRGYDWGSNLSLGNLFGPGGLGDLGVPQAADVNSLLNNVGAIKNNTGKIAKTVDLSDEQLKMMVDIAERKFVNNINLTSQAPVITVQGQNTGNTEADRQSLADLLGDLIMERVQSGSVVAVN